MPHYQYVCKRCGRELEIFHGMSERRSDCPECKTEGSLVRILASFTINKPFEAVRNNGDIVKRSIEEYKEALKEQIEELKEQSNEFKD